MHSNKDLHPELHPRPPLPQPHLENCHNNFKGGRVSPRLSKFKRIDHFY
jgi:hypothetical protein